MAMEEEWRGIADGACLGRRKANGTYPWMASSSLGQKSWHPGYQASLTDLFLKKNPLHFGTGISQLAAASSYIEKMSPPNEHMHKCTHLEGKDKNYPCDTCTQYFGILRTDGTSSNSSRPSIGTPVSLGSPSERKAMGLPSLPSGVTHAERAMNGCPPGMMPGPPRPRPPPNKQFLCPVCHKLFTQKGNLKTHMMIHTGEKPYACQVCGKSFTQKGNVDTHMKIHTGEKDFACESCGKRFTQKGNLKTHIRSVHTKEKPFACSVCGKSFSQRGNMQTHMRTHNKDDRFPCTMCGKTFSQKGNLKTHMQRHTGQIPSKRNYNRGMNNPNNIRRISQAGAHLPPFNFHTASVLPQGAIPSSMNPSLASKSLFSKIGPHNQHLDMSRVGINLTYPHDTHNDCRSPMTSPMPLVTSSAGLPGPQSYQNTSSSPNPSQLSSPSPVDEMGMAHMLQNKSQQHDSHPPTPNHLSENVQRSQMHSPPITASDLRMGATPPVSTSGSQANDSESEGRPFYSAPPTPVPGPFVTASRWLSQERSRYYDSFQHHSGLGSYNAISQHTTPLSRLSLLASGSMAQHLNQQEQQQQQQQQQQEQQPSSDEKPVPLQDSQFPAIGNHPDFSQLLD